MIYQLVWATKDESAFEQAVPLLWHGNHMSRSGWDHGIKIGFLEGIHLLSKEYLRQLERLGYEIIDCHSLVEEALEEYPELNRYDVPNKYWFLRWNVMDALTKLNAPDSTVIHCDADVVFMSDPKKICADVHGKTFVLEGCPVLTVISTREWYRVWREELALFLRDPEAYTQNALTIKDEPVMNSREYCNVLCYQAGRFHDQDMLEYLIAAGKLPQSRTEEIFDSPFYWVQNPLFPGEWHREQCGEAKKKIIERSDGTYVGGKRMALYHFQTDFSRYCSQWLQLDRVRLGGWAEVLRLHAEKRRLSVPGQVMGKALELVMRRKNLTKRAVYEGVFRKNRRTGNLYINDIVNSCWRL